MRSLSLAEDVDRLRMVIEHTQGNLTRAAALLEVSKQYVMNLVKKHELNTWAREIRVASGAPATGNPHR